MAFEDIGFMLMDIAKMCDVDAARIVTGAAIAASLATSDQSGFHLVGSAPLNAPDGTPARLLLLCRVPRELTERQRMVLSAMALQAQTLLLEGAAAVPLK